jgi:hypothetical protein
MRKKKTGQDYIMSAWKHLSNAYHGDAGDVLALNLLENFHQVFPYIVPRAFIFAGEDRFPETGEIYWKEPYNK